MTKAPHITLRFGPLPVDVINKTLNLELDPGEAILTPSHQVHAARRHPEDYARCQPHVAAILANPLWIGDDFKNEGKIELVGRVAAIGGPLLVAVKIAVNANGCYEVASFYPVAETTVESRRAKGYLRLAKKC